MRFPHSIHQSQCQDAISTSRGCQDHQCFFSAHLWLPTKCCTDSGVEKEEWPFHGTGLQAEVVQVLNGGNHVPSHLLQYMLQQVFPKSVVLDAQLLTNFRLKAKRLGPTCAIKSMDISLAALQELRNLNFADGDETPFLDLATKHACEILQEALMSNENNWKVQVYIDKLASKDTGFAYHIARAADGRPQVLSG